MSGHLRISGDGLFLCRRSVHLHHVACMRLWPGKHRQCVQVLAPSFTLCYNLLVKLCV